LPRDGFKPSCFEKILEPSNFNRDTVRVVNDSEAIGNVVPDTRVVKERAGMALVVVKVD
jgi:hypothetical protein